MCTEGCVSQGENTLLQLSPPFSALAGADWVLRPNMAQRRARHFGRFCPLRALALDFDFKNRAVFPQERKKECVGIIRRTKTKKSSLASKCPKSLLQLLPMTEVPSSMMQNMQC